jgi:pimeloyl-ACP methyl ester carboxylesterase
MRITLPLAGLLLLTLTGNAQRKGIPCDGSSRPLVYVHGFLGSGDNWALQSQRMEANGYCPDRVSAFDWNSLDRKANSDSLLELHIRGLLKRTKASQVDLVGHSAGGGLCARFLSKPERAALVARYVHVGSGPLPGLPGGVPTLNIYSAGDRVAARAADVPGATNLRQASTDHLEVVTSEESFQAIMEFLRPGMKTRLDFPAPSVMEVSGRALVLGENTPLGDCPVEAWVHDARTGQRVGKAPAWSGRTDAEGRWGGLKAKPGTHYEFIIRPATGRVVHYFHEPFRHHNRLLYLRALPSTGMAAALLSGLPRDSASSALAVFTANRAVVTGRDTLGCNNLPLSTPSLTPPEKTCIALFLYDQGADGKGDGKPLPMFAAAPFMNGADLAMPAREKAGIRLHYNGRTRVLPTVPSSEGVMVAVFD